MTLGPDTAHAAIAARIAGDSGPGAGVTVSVHGGSRPRSGRAASRDRLLEAAAPLFADRGYFAASVREITSAAGCNVASVNYHFGGKENLYREVFRLGLGALRERRLASVRLGRAEARGGASLERLLGTFAAVFLEPATGRGNGGDIVQLLVREWMDPHLPRDVFQDELVGPVREALADAIRETCPGLDRVRARQCAQSFVAQLVQVIHHHRLFGTFGEWTGTPMRLESVASHIVRFSAAGTRACARRSRGEPSSPNRRAARRHNS